MAQPYVGEIRMFAGNFAPVGWMLCDGQLLPISEYETLFQLIGTTYGGDGESTFALPNLQSRIPIHMGTGSFGTTYQLGEMGGVESVTLTTQQIPAHTHALLATASTATLSSPAGQVLAPSVDGSVLGYGTDNPVSPLAAGSITPVGGNQPHENTQPFLCINYIISMFGIFPSPT
ncbi:phage tail protein [Deinococcus misasensis]|uniref:phage tail protein n=1 Tax=Deinococcus misasensis TaxID=392413 RepID=UPI0005590A33|nr:tail fiber protein [Deinococcus misasensis]